MAWSLYGEWLKTSDFSGSPVFHQPFVLNRKTVIKTIRTWVVLYNAPVFSSLELRIYSSVSSAPASIIATSSKTWVLSEVSDENNCAKEIYFDFEWPPTLNGDDTYHIVLWANGYTGTESSHVAWVRSVPDPANTGYTVTLESIARAPFRVAFVGDEL